MACFWLGQAVPAFAQTSVTTSARAQARAHFEQGAEHYRNGRYEDAIKAFSAAYELEPAGALLLNIAQANRLKAPPDCEAALKHYELYLAAEPRAAERAEVESYIKQMRVCVEQERKASATPPVTIERAVPPPLARPRSYAPLWAAGAGAVVLLGGAGLYTRARLRFNQLKDQCPCPDDTIDGWQTATNVSYAMMVAGGITAAAALAVWWWPRQEDSVERQTMAATWLPGQGLQLSWQGRF